MIFVRNWIGGPFAGGFYLFMVPDTARRVRVVDGDIVLGYYVRSNLGWSWHP